MFIPDSGSRGQKKAPDPGSGSATLQYRYKLQRKLKFLFHTDDEGEVAHLRYVPLLALILQAALNTNKLYLYRYQGLGITIFSKIWQRDLF